MVTSGLSILLADDDWDDCSFFREALEELSLNLSLQVVHDGVKLIEFLLKNPADLPDILFLDLNMPLMNGFDCLTEIKRVDALKTLPVVIFSTSLDRQSVEILHKNGASCYIQKPGSFAKFKVCIAEAISVIEQDLLQPLPIEKFVLQV